MALYEITFLTKEEADPGVKAAIEEAGGTIQVESTMGRRRLVYPINKETQAVYTTFVFDINEAAQAALDRKLRLNTAIIRHLIVTKRIPKANKEVSKTVREAIAAAEMLEDTVAEPVNQEVVNTNQEETEATKMEALDKAIADEIPAEEAPDETVVTEETTPEVTETAKEEKPKRAPKKAAKNQDASEATEEDRLKALEDKLSDILKD